MATRMLVGNLRTGGRIVELPGVGTWSDTLLTAESLSCVIDLGDPELIALDLKNTTTPAQNYLAAVEGDYILAAGPIWFRQKDTDEKSLTITASGLASYYDHRLILPPSAMTRAVTTWTIPDPADATKTVSNPAVRTTFTAESYSNMIKKLIQQAHAWTGGSLPVVFPDDEAGDYTKTYDGTDFKILGEAINQIAQLDDGVEFDFRPRFTAGQQGIEWVLVIGTKAKPFLSADRKHEWSFGSHEGSASGLVTTEDASELTSLAWQVGGKQADKVLLARAYDPILVNAGYPLIENLDSSHSSVSVQATLNAYAVRDTIAGRYPFSTSKFSVPKYPIDSETLAPYGPVIGEFQVGDFCDIVMEKFDPLTGAGDVYEPMGGRSENRIIGLAGSTDSDYVDVTTAPRISR